MSYIELSACFVGAAVLAAVALWLASGRNRAHLGAMAVTIVVLFILTAAFDTLMIAAGLFHYAPDQLLGVRIGLAPLEDFAYPLAGAVLLPALWSLLRARRRARAGIRAAEEDQS